MPDEITHNKKLNIKKIIMSFLEYRRISRTLEAERFAKEQQRVGGIFTASGATDEEIIDKGNIDSLNNDSEPL